MTKFILFLPIIFASCTNSSTGNTKIESMYGDSILVKNDTFCSTPHFDSHKMPVQTLSACHVVFSDSMNNLLSLKYQQQILYKEFNSVNDSSSLIYERSGDTILCKFIFIVPMRDAKMAADTMYFKKDTLFLKEKALFLAKKEILKGIGYEEFVYRFLYKGSKLVIKNITK